MYSKHPIYNLSGSGSSKYFSNIICNYLQTSNTLSVLIMVSLLATGKISQNLTDLTLKLLVAAQLTCNQEQVTLTVTSQLCPLVINVVNFFVSSNLDLYLPDQKHIFTILPQVVELCRTQGRYNLKFLSLSLTGYFLHIDSS